MTGPAAEAPDPVPGQGPPPEAPEPEGADDLEVLIPERTLVIRGEEVTVRELTLAQTMRLARPIARITEGLLNLVAWDDEAPEPDLDAIAPVLEARWEDFVTLMAAACGRSRDWVAALPDSQGNALTTTWWEVHAPFFTRRIVRRALARMGRDQALAATAAAQAAGTSGGPPCSPG